MRLLLIFVACIFCYSLLGNEPCLVYILTVGSWGVDLKLKEMTRVDIATRYADLSFVCCISIFSQIAAYFGLKLISIEEGVRLLVISLALLILWLCNVHEINVERPNIGNWLKRFYASFSVFVLMAGPIILQTITKYKLEFYKWPI